MSDYDVILTVGIDKNDAIKQVADAMGIAQKTADENAITYKFSADKKQFLSELHNMLAKTPDLTKHINIEFDDSSFKKGMDDLEKYAGKTTADIIRSINKEFKNYSGGFSDKMVRSLLGASSKGPIPSDLYRKKAGEIAVELNKYIGSDGALDLSKVANYKELEHVISLAKDLNVILNNVKGKNVFSDKSAASMLGKQVEAVKKGYSQAISKFGDSYKQQLTNIKTNTETEFAAIFQMLIAGLTNAGEMGSELFKELGEEFKASVQGAGDAMADEIGEGVAASKEHLKELEKQLDDIKKKKATLSTDSDLKKYYDNVERAASDFWSGGKNKKKSQAYAQAMQELTNNILHPENDSRWNTLRKDYESANKEFTKGDYIPIEQMKTRSNLQQEAIAQEERLEQEIANEKKLLEEANKARTGNGTGGGGGTGTGTGGTGASGTGTGTSNGTGADTVANVNIEQALENIQTLKQELDSIPETKTITIDLEYDPEKIKEVKSTSVNSEEAATDAVKQYELSSKPFKQAGNLKQLREQYHWLVMINKELQLYNEKGKKQSIGKLNASYDELKTDREEILSLNPVLQQVANDTKKMSRTPFDAKFKDVYGEDISKEVKKEMPKTEIELTPKLSSDFTTQVQEQLDGISPKPIIKIDAELNEEGISKVNEQLKEIRNSFEGVGTMPTSTTPEVEESIVEEELLDQESITRALDLQNSSLEKKISYLQEIKKYSHFMEDAEERKMDWEERGWDVDREEKYDKLCDDIKTADQALNEFEEDFNSFYIKKKNEETIEIFEPSDLDNLRLAKNEIEEIQVLLNSAFLDDYLSSKTLKTDYGKQQYDSIVKSYQTGKISADEAIRSIERLNQEIENGTQAANTAEQTSEGLKKEGKSFSEIVDEAAKATDAKKNFAEANKEVLNSIIQSLNGLNSEGEGFNNLNKLISNLANNKDDRIVNLVKNITALKDALSSSVDGNSFIKALENIAGQGDNLKAMADILKESQQKIKEAAKSMVQPKEDTVKSFVQNSDLSRYLSDAQKVIADNPIKLAAKLDEAAFKREIERIAPSIAEDFNKQYGTAITGSDVVKAFQEIQNEEKKAYEAAQREAQKAEEAEKKRIAQVQKESAQRKSDQEVQQQREINELLNKRKQAYDEIWKINKQLADPNKGEKERKDLKKKKEEYQQDYINATKNLKALDETAITEEHINELYEIRKKILNEIRQVNARREDNQKDAELAERSQKEYEKLANTVNKYVEAKTRIASGNALKDDVKNADELKEKIFEIRDNLSSGELYDLKLEEKALKPLNTLADKLDVISQKTKAISADKQFSLNLDKDIELNNLIKYEDELEKLGLITPEVREELDKLYDGIANADINKGLTNYKKNLTLFKQKMAEPVKSKKDENVSAEKNVNSIINQQEKAYQKVWDIKKKIATLSPEKDAPLIASLKSQEQTYYGIYNKKTEELRLLDEEAAKEQRLTNIAEIRRKAEEDIKNIKASQAGNDIQKQVNGAITKYAELTRLQKELIANQRNPYITDADNVGLTNRINTLEAEIKAVRELKDADGNLLLTTEQLKALNDAYAKSELEISQARIKDAAAAKKQKDAGQQQQQLLEKTRSSLLQQATQLANNGKLMRVYGDQVRQFIKELSDTGTAKERLEEIRVELMRIKSDANLTGNTGKTFMDVLKGRFTSLGAYLGTFASFYRVVGYVKEAINTIRELDTELVDLRKTTKMTSSELDQFYLESNKISKEFGVATKEIISQAAAWSRLGYNTKEASIEMAKLSSLFATVSPGMTTENSTDYLVSTMQAFGIAVDDVERKILDNVNSIGNAFATTNAEIGEMLTRSSAAMNAANNSLEETIALESAAVEITRNAETTGTAFRTENCPYVQQCA